MASRALIPGEHSFLPQSTVLFHLLASCFSPGLFLDINFMLSFAVAMAVLSSSRLCPGRGPPLGGTIHEYMRRQVDSRDEGGPLFLTHLYLLAGCATPLWLSSVLMAPSSVPCFAAAKNGAISDSEAVTAAIPLLSGAAGLIATGVGDAMGAVVGSWVRNRHSIPGTRKSFEGSAAMFSSMVLFVGLARGCGSVH